MKEERFSKYCLMDCNDIEIYLKRECNVFGIDSVLNVEEIGDGNINYVYRVMEKETGKSFIVKQAAKEARISVDMKLDMLRGEREAEALRIYDKIVPGFVPKVYNYDKTMCAVIMQDIEGFTVARKGLIDFNIYPKFAEQISTFLARTLFFTSDIYLNHNVKRKLLKKFINSDLCDLTENLVFTEPYNNMNNKNIITNENRELIKEEIYGNKKLHLEIAELKFNFMTNTQALIHGDLHTGSMFVKEDKLVVFDPEFVFYGPMGYDIGNVVANFAMELCRISCFIKFGLLKDRKFYDWISNTITWVIDSFINKFICLYEENIDKNDVMARTAGFKERYL